MRDASRGRVDFAGDGEPVGDARRERRRARAARAGDAGRRRTAQGSARLPLYEHTGPPLHPRLARGRACPRREPLLGAWVQVRARYRGDRWPDGDGREKLVGSLAILAEEVGGVKSEVSHLTAHTSDLYFHVQ